jgi:hypothetical protein
MILAGQLQYPTILVAMAPSNQNLTSTSWPQVWQWPLANWPLPLGSPLPLSWSIPNQYVAPPTSQQHASTTIPHQQTT